jgi:hypothetical protein
MEGIAKYNHLPWKWLILRLLMLLWMNLVLRMLVLLVNHVSEPELWCNDDDVNEFFHDRHVTFWSSRMDSWTYFGCQLHFNGPHPVYVYCLVSKIMSSCCYLRLKLRHRVAVLKVQTNVLCVWDTFLLSWLRTATVNYLTTS